MNSTVTDEEFIRTIATVAATPSQLRHAFQSLMARGQNSIDNVRPFILHPLIEVEAGVYTAINVEALGDTLIGDGLFWRLKPAPAASQQEKSDFGETLGHLLEQHCLDVAESVYGLKGSPKRLFPEFKYSEGDGPDLVIADDRAAAFIEIGIDRPNLRQTVYRGDLESYDSDVKRLILPRAEQLDRKIQHALEGTLGFQGAPPATASTASTRSSAFGMASLSGVTSISGLRRLFRPPDSSSSQRSNRSASSACRSSSSWFCKQG